MISSASKGTCTGEHLIGRCSPKRTGREMGDTAEVADLFRSHVLRSAAIMPAREPAAALGTWQCRIMTLSTRRR